MSHQPFEAWILGDENLTSEQRRLLHDHLDECGRCLGLRTSWEGARTALIDLEMVGPEPGFENRWRARYAGVRVRDARRQISWMLGLTLLAGGMLAIPLAIQLYAMLDAPATFSGAVIRDILSIDLTLRLAGGLVRALMGEVSSRLSPAGWAGIGLALMTSTAAWVLSLYRFAFQPVERGG